jgi:hypothetical protein
MSGLAGWIHMASFSRFTEITGNKNGSGDLYFFVKFYQLLFNNVGAFIVLGSLFMARKYLKTKWPQFSGLVFTFAIFPVLSFISKNGDMRYRIPFALLLFLVAFYFLAQISWRKKWPIFVALGLMVVGNLVIRYELFDGTLIRQSAYEYWVPQRNGVKFLGDTTSRVTELARNILLHYKNLPEPHPHHLIFQISFTDGKFQSTEVLAEEALSLAVSDYTSDVELQYPFLYSIAKFEDQLKFLQQSDMLILGPQELIYRGDESYRKLVNYILTGNDPRFIRQEPFKQNFESAELTFYVFKVQSDPRDQK